VRFLRFIALHVNFNAVTLVTPLTRKFFGAWTLLAAIVRFQCALDSTNVAIWQTTYGTFLLAIALYGYEFLVTKTIPFLHALAPFIVAGRWPFSLNFPFAHRILNKNVRCIPRLDDVLLLSIQYLDNIVCCSKRMRNVCCVYRRVLVLRCLLPSFLRTENKKRGSRRIAMMWGGGTAPHPTSVKVPNEKVSTC